MNQGAIVADAELLFELHRQGVLRYLSRAVGRPDTAQDLTQEVFLRVTRAPVPVPATDPSGRRAWVFKIARNLLLNHRRDMGRRGEVVPLGERAAPATQELAVAIQEALERLAEMDRDVFLMRESGGLSYEEIANACDLTVEAVRARLHRTRQELRVALGGTIDRGRREFVTFRVSDGEQGD